MSYISSWIDVKIILLAGKTAGLKDEQLDEIAKLPKGVAVVYQNDWVDPVLCRIQKYKGQEGRYKYKPTSIVDKSTPRLKKKLLELLLAMRVKNRIDADIEGIKSLLPKADLTSKIKLAVKKLVSEYEKKVNYERGTKIDSMFFQK